MDDSLFYNKNNIDTKKNIFCTKIIPKKKKKKNI